jgi:hypothetical protein
MAQTCVLLTYEGLLSAAYKKTTMIEDAFSAIDMLQHVTVELVDAGVDQVASGVNTSNNHNLGPKSINIAGSRVIRAMELVRYNDHGNEEEHGGAATDTGTAPLVDLLGGMTMGPSSAPSAPTPLAATASSEGQGESLVVRVALDSSYFHNRLPACLRALGTRVRFYAMLFQMGVDIMQRGANVHATSERHTTHSTGHQRSLNQGRLKMESFKWPTVPPWNC